MSDQVASTGEPAVKRACDPCRSRKVKCDKSIPCSNCVVANRTCISTGFGQKSGGLRQRVLISTQYEQKVDQIAGRLNDIEQVLQDVVSLIRRQDLHPSGSLNIPSQPKEGYPSKLTPQIEETTRIIEGNSSLIAHTNLVSNQFRHTVKHNNLPDLAPNIQPALLALQNIIERQHPKANGNESGFPNQQPLPTGGLRQLPMPPPQLVLQILRDLEENGPAVPFALHCIFLPVKSLTEYSRKVYSGIDNFDISTFIVVNGGLFYLLGQQTLVPDHQNKPHERADFLRYRKLCADNMSAGLGRLSLFLPTSEVSIQALLMGANYAIETSRPSLAWNMSNLAAQMCLKLGYHRMSSSSDAATNMQRDIFNYTYMINKATSLRLGITSALQDYDISVPVCPSPKLGDTLWRTIVVFRIRHSQTQGKIYDQLYSSEALRTPLGPRVQSAMALAQHVKSMLREVETLSVEVGRILDSQKSPVYHGWEVILNSDIITCYSMLTLIYRAIPQDGSTTSIYAEECNRAALAAFQYHSENMQRIAGSPVAQAGYIHWTLLYVPFIPLVVKFCHTIETSNEGDLQQLESFAASLLLVCHLSEAIEQLHLLAQALYNVASLYIKVKTSCMGAHDALLLEPEFQGYTRHLGLIADAQHGTMGITTQMPSIQSAHVGAWWAENPAIIGLSEEEDLAEIFP